MYLLLFAWLGISKALLVFRQKDNLLLPRCIILLTRQTSQSEIFILLIMQTHHTSGSLFQTITNPPGLPPHLSHVLLSTWNHTLAALSGASVKGKQTTPSPRAALTHPKWQRSHEESGAEEHVELQEPASDLLLWEPEGKTGQDTVTEMLWLMKPTTHNHHLEPGTFLAPLDELHSIKSRLS